MLFSFKFTKKKSMKKKIEIRNFAVLVATSLLLFSCGQSSNKQHSSVDSAKCDSVSHKTVATVTQTKESQMSITPQKALEMLKEGNFRFTSNQVLKRDFKLQVHQTAEGQFPFASF